MSNKIDRRVLRTRQLLRNALLSLIQERDFESLTVQDITERATLNRATFYLHYADKHDLLLQVIRETLVELTDLPLPHPYEAPATAIDSERIHAFFVLVFQHVLTNLTFYRVMLESGGTSGATEEIHTTINKVGMWMMGRVEIVQWRVSPEVVMSMISGAYLGMIRWTVAQPTPPTAEQLATQFTQVMMPGILNAMNRSL